jgi:phthiodiolone/phenolphthiodiolone dimycocerosates ketoreductase
MSKLRFGFVEISVGPLQAIQDGIRAERAGFDTIWIPDHATDVNGDKLEPWTVLSAIAVQTRRVRLASAVTDTQRSHPARTAHATACLDVISRGRVILGIGAGEAMNIVPFGLPWEEPAERVARLEEAIRIIRLLWGSGRENMVNFGGRYFKLSGAFLSLPPYRKPHPPVFVGALGSRSMLEVAGRLGEGWLSWINTPETFSRRWKIVEEAARRAGRSPKSIEATSHLMIALPRNREEKRAAMLGAKSTLLMEKRVLESMGYTAHLDFIHYQNFTISREYVAEIMEAASEIPDEYVHRVMAIGEMRDVEEKIDSLAKAGAKHLAIADFLAPKTVRRTLESFAKIRGNYS